jgi:hypothetical protein
MQATFAAALSVAVVMVAAPVMAEGNAARGERLFN